MKTKRYAFIIFLSILMLAGCDNLLFRNITGIFRATFEANGGSEVTPMEAVTIDSAPSTTKEDYQFDGWYLQSTLSDEATFPYTMTENTTFYAKWLQKFLVTFETDGGTIIPSAKYAIIDTEPVSTKGGFALDGWYTTSNFSGNPVTFPYSVTADTTFYAKWVPTFNVQFESNGGSYVSSYTAAKIVTEPETLRDGYSFCGWYTDASFNNRVYFPYILTEDTTLYAKWKQKFTVTFDTQGGSAIASIFTSDIADAPSPTKENKDFAGWYTDINYSEISKVVFPYSVESEVTLYAKWIPQQCTVVYDSNGGTGGTVPASVNVDKGSSYIISANTGNLVKNGYAFTKWNTKADGTGTNYTPGQTISSVMSNITLFAQWGLDYSAMITVNGGTFAMGVENSETSPLHNVTVSAFQLAQYELTYELWTEVRNWALNNGYSITNASKGGTGKDRFTNFEPATHISFCEAVIWCNAYSEYRGLTPCYYLDSTFSSAFREEPDKSTLRIYWNTAANGYRLPTEAEWEYAAGGGEIANRCVYSGTSGSTDIKDYAWYSANANEETHPVGKKKANTLGFYDMSGNAWEWCFSTNYTYSVDDEINPRVTSVYTSYDSWSTYGGDSVVYRGGSYETNNISGLKINSRFWTNNAQTNYWCGIRVARNEE